MPWYSAGTVAVTNNSPTVTGSGTTFSANARVGDAFRGPDGLWYEVTNVASAAVISIKPNYQGANSAAGSYAIAPMQGYVKDSADALRGFVNQYGALLASIGPWSIAENQEAARSELGLGPLSVWVAGEALTLPGKGVRIRADLSTATLTDRLMVQTSVTNGMTSLSMLPNGTSTSSDITAWQTSDVNNSPYGQIQVTAGEVRISAGATGTASVPSVKVNVGGSTRMTVDNNISLGSQSPGAIFSGASGVYFDTANGMPWSTCTSGQWVFSRSSDGSVLQFRRGTETIVGSITTSATATAYNTSSDYRLKSDVQPLDPVEATGRILAYEPCTWKWLVDGSDGKGFIAHKNQAVDPSTATGRKDEVQRMGNIRLPNYSLVRENVLEPEDMTPYGEGAEWVFTHDEPVYQGRDDSKMIPDMVAMMQRQEGRIAELEAHLQQVLAILQPA